MGCNSVTLLCFLYKIFICGTVISLPVLTDHESILHNHFIDLFAVVTILHNPIFDLLHHPIFDLFAIVTMLSWDDLALQFV